MQPQPLCSSILAELGDVLHELDPCDADSLMTQLKSSSRIFVTGAGRSLLMLKAFAMRLMHLGSNVYVVGETTTPPIHTGDLLICASASGQTASVRLNVQQAKQQGARVAVITANPHSEIAALADSVFLLAAATHQSAESSTSIQPGGSLFEQSLLILCDSIILAMCRSRKIDPAKPLQQHANLE